jgi:hypothetical protein
MRLEIALRDHGKQERRTFLMHYIFDFCGIFSTEEIRPSAHGD